MDGLSTDGTAGIVARYTTMFPVKFVSEKDNGLYDAMNKGLDMAKGKWIYFLGSDDELYNHDILSSIRALIWNHAETNFIYGDIITSDGTLETYQDYTYDQLLSRCICQQSIFYHHTLFKKLRFDICYKLCADWDLNLKVFRKKNNPLYAKMVVAKFDLGGVSSKWQEHPEYLEHFADRKKMILRYRGIAYLWSYALRKMKMNNNVTG
jgi:glycosyltransferase involved in cell wall biosynthesis